MSESQYCSYHAADRKEAFHAASITACPYCEIDRLTAQLAEWHKVFGHLSKDADTAGNMINEGIAERDAVAAEKVVERARLADENAALRAEIARLQQQSVGWVQVFDENAALRTQLSERDAEVARQKRHKERTAMYLRKRMDKCQKAESQNAALRGEVERIREANRQLAGAAICPDHLNPENVRKQAAAEILDSLTQEEIRRITSVGDPRVTTISSKLLAMMAELRQRYGLEG